ncbi:MAG: Uma2 family endonuclease, partial [Bacteroidota bacterium]
MDTQTLTPAIWLRALDDPALRDLPFKIETNAYDQLVLSPHKPRHTFAQKRLTELLDARVEGEGVAYAELAVETSEGIKVPDVVWI